MDGHGELAESFFNWRPCAVEYPYSRLHRARWERPECGLSKSGNIYTSLPIVLLNVCALLSGRVFCSLVSIEFYAVRVRCPIRLVLKNVLYK